ncbi:hypothetical protein [Kitasatospora sp. NPDC087315]|uniref:hypothetical protein n=1 Tax=Kitasatospora sp. NPDC087315 TaxID=3364069 RepID=UPI0037F4E6E2
MPGRTGQPSPGQGDPGAREAAGPSYAALPAAALPWAASGTGTGPAPDSPEDDWAYECSTWDGFQRFVDTPVPAPPAPGGPPRSAEDKLA